MEKTPEFDSYEMFKDYFDETKCNMTAPFLYKYSSMFSMLGGLCPEYWLFYSGSSKAYLEEYETLHHFEKVLAKAIKNNPEKFPAGYIFELNKSEKQEVIKKFDNLQIKFSPASPKAFTEKGLYMLATILKSKRETDTTIERRRF